MTAGSDTKPGLSLDYRILLSIIPQQAKVLDLGCGEGELLSLLVSNKSVIGQGIELNEKSIYTCVAKGLSVFQSDIDQGLAEFPDKSFDYIIINQTLQQVRNIEFVLDEALRVGRFVAVGFPNFGHINVRAHLFFKGKAPVTSGLPYFWYNTPNTRFLTIADFRLFCKKKNIQILKKFYLGQNARVYVWPNLFAQNAVFLLNK